MIKRKLQLQWLVEILWPYSYTTLDMTDGGASQAQGSENTAHLKGKLNSLTETCR